MGILQAEDSIAISNKRLSDRSEKPMLQDQRSERTKEEERHSPRIQSSVIVMKEGPKSRNGVKENLTKSVNIPQKRITRSKTSKIHDVSEFNGKSPFRSKRKQDPELMERTTAILTKLLAQCPYLDLFDPPVTLQDNTGEADIVNDTAIS